MNEATESGSEIVGVLAGLATSDMGRGIRWLSTVLGQEPSARPMEILADWYLRPAGTIQLVLDPERAGGSMVTVEVGDIDAVGARLARSGIAFDYDATSSALVSFGTLEDPDGNSVTILAAKDGFAPQG